MAISQFSGVFVYMLDMAKQTKRKSKVEQHAAEYLDHLYAEFPHLQGLFTVSVDRRSVVLVDSRDPDDCVRLQTAEVRALLQRYRDKRPARQAA